LLLAQSRGEADAPSEQADEAEAEQPLDEDEEMPEASCAVCFEPVSESARLPCDCAVSYCICCWDRCLAAGLNSAGRARCPTCRTAVRVDFDLAARRVIFSKEQEDDDEGVDDGLIEDIAVAGDARFAPGPRTVHNRPTAARHARVMERLVEQARPAQILFLQQFGEQQPSLRAAASTAIERMHASEAAMDRVQQEQNAQKAAGSRGVHLFMSLQGLREVARAEWVAAEESMAGVGCAAAHTCRPPCVCGARLIHVSYRERLARYMTMRLPNLAGAPEELERVVEMSLMHDESCYYCDICGGSQADGGVWTCENGNHTVLHANAYDVCERCFALCCAGMDPDD